ncbi:MAG: HTTM domain-containing protein [Crocinitomicaceae bacterium]
MKNKVFNYISFWFNQDFRYADRISVFKKLLMLFIILNSFIVLLGAHSILGPEAYFQSAPPQFNGISPLISFWNYPAFLPYNWVFIIMLMVFAALVYLEKFERWMTFLVFIFWMNFLSRTTVINTGGEVLVGLFLFYLMFVGRVKSEDKNLQLVQNAMNNTFTYAIVIQFLSVYIISSWWKMLDEGWMGGFAFLHAINIDTYSFFGLGEFLYNHVWIAKSLTYLALLYQVAFPLLVWNKKIKPYLLFVGVLFHLGIAIMMGIFSFGLVMIISYSLFLNDRQLEKIKKKMPFVKSD